MKKNVAAALVCLVAVEAMAAPKPKVTAPPKYDVAEIPRPGQENLGCAAGYQSFTYARRLNEYGQAVGHTDCHVATGDPTRPYLQRGFHAFAWSAATGSFTLARDGSYARDINESGLVIGQGGDFESIALWTLAGGEERIRDAMACTSLTLVLDSGVNDSGTYAFSSHRLDPGGSCQRRLVLRRANGDEVVGPTGFRGYAMNNGEVVVGSAQGSAAKWSAATGLVLLATDSSPGATSKLAWNLNAAGDAVGFATRFGDSCTGATDAYYWPAAGGSTRLPPLAGFASAQASGINDAGTAVGSSQSSDCLDEASARATLWSGGQAWDLNQLIPKNLGIHLFFASAINGRGQILVRGIRPSEGTVTCAVIEFDDSGQEYYTTQPCRTSYAFILTPRR
jgi:uncharacterized membrane protein